MNLRRSIILFALTMFAASAPGQTNLVYSWKTFTGQPGGTGNANGVGAWARFNYPYGAAADSAGNVYVADTYNNTIRKVTGSGMVTTLAGSAGQAGSVDGIGNAARFSSPTSVAVDSTGNVYVADTYNHTIRKVTSAGIVTTLAGSAGQVGSEDGIGSAARFNEPYGVAVNSAGDLYVTDAGNYTIRKVTSGGVVTTLAGSAGQFGSANGTNGAARFDYPAGVALDNLGNIYVADLDNSTIRKITSSGVVTTLAGTAGTAGSADGTNGSAQFYYPSSVTVDSAGNVYVADTYNSTIRKVNNSGVVSTFAGSAGMVGNADGTNSTARFYYPSGLTADSAGNLYVADTDNSIIRKITTAGAVTTLAGSVEHSGSADADGSAARFNSPNGAAVDGAGNVFVADTLNHTIRKITPGGLVTTLAGKPGQAGSADGTNGMARFNQPYAVAFDGTGNLYVADTLNQTIRKVTSNGAVTTLAGSAGQSGNADGTNGAARFAAPTGVAVDGAGNLYVADFSSSTLRKVTSDGVVTTLAGSAGQSGIADGTNNTARFNGPYGVSVDGAGNIYVTDSFSHTIRKVTSAGVVTTLAGSAGQSGNANGTNNTARFFAPAGMAADSTGNLYVTDIGNSTIRKVTGGGVVTTLAGSAGQIGSLDGTGSVARFFAPSGVAVDSVGNLRIADSANHNIRKVTSDGVVTTLAGGAGQSGSNDVAADIARFYRPSAVSADSAGNLYVADSYNNTIRKISSDGAVTTLAGYAGQIGSGNGTGSSARFYYPYGLAVDATGNVFVADSYNNTIRKVTSGGLVTTLAGSPGQLGSADGTGSAARFSSPSGVAVDNSGSVYVADFDNSTIRKITSSGVVTTLAGSAGQSGSIDGTGGAARFGFPNGVAVDGAGNLFVADSGNSTLRMVTSGGIVTTLAGSAGHPGSTDGTGAAARFDYPAGIALDSAGNIYVADAGNSTIRRVTHEGVVTTIGGYAGVVGGQDGIGNSASFAGPSGITVDGNGRIYVADAGNNRISRGIRLPVLTIASSNMNVVMSWPAPSAGFTLQQSSALGLPNNWFTTTNSLSDDGTNKSVSIAIPVGNQFFRLILNE